MIIQPFAYMPFDRMGLFSICVDFLVYDFEGKLYKSQVLTLGFETH